MNITLTGKTIDAGLDFGFTTVLTPSDAGQTTVSARAVLIAPHDFGASGYKVLTAEITLTATANTNEFSGVFPGAETQKLLRDPANPASGLVYPSVELLVEATTNTLGRKTLKSDGLEVIAAVFSNA